MEYSREYLVHYYEIDLNKKLQVSSLVHYLEDIAILNSALQGFTLDYYDRNNKGWMLYKWDIKIRRMPEFNEMVKINTRPKAFKNFLANRDYDIFDRKGNLLAEAKSVWLLADTKTRKPVRVPEEMYAGFDISVESDLIFEKLDELETIKNGGYSKKISVGKSDIDTNNHVNNVRYIDWSIESLPSEFTGKHQVAQLKVNYKKELNPGDEAQVISNVSYNKNIAQSKHSVFNNGKEICNLFFEWINNYEDERKL